MAVFRLNNIVWPRDKKRRVGGEKNWLIFERRLDEKDHSGKIINFGILFL